jgi:hypothetical protein
MVARFDLASVEQKYSSLGRHGYAPRSVLGVWIYASLLGLHESTKVARALKTDAAFRLLSGGYAISEGTLRRFRRENRELFERLIVQTVCIAHEEGLLKVDELAVDSWRVRAEASLAAVGTLERSKARLDELTAIDEAALGEEERLRRDKSLAKHRAIVEECERRGRTNVVRTNPSAGLLKFPYGASAPGHRVTVTAAGATERIVVSAFVDAAPTDHGHLGPAIDGALAILALARALDGRPARAAADAGYWSEEDLVYAAENAHRIAIHVPDQNADRRSRYFNHDRFRILDDVASCPAGAQMRGPVKDGDGNLRYFGVGCAKCPLRSQCTSGVQRTLTVRPAYERAKLEMQQRTAPPGAQAFYKKRLAIIESVFANVEDVMGYRRATARVERSVVAEILLKLLAHNVSRLLAGRDVATISFVLEVGDEF